MLHRTCRLAAVKGLLLPASNSRCAYRVTRQFSVISINSSFPTSLLRYNSQQRSNLFDHKNQGSDDVADDAVTVSSDGLVYPAVTKNMPCSHT